MTEWESDGLVLLEDHRRGDPMLVDAVLPYLLVSQLFS